jgi:hypothetical protein
MKLQKSKKTWRMFCAWLAFLAITAGVRAQSYTIDWYKTSGGGGASSGGQFSVSGTVGQHDAGGAMSGGNFSLTGGFWSFISVMGPSLTISHAGNNVVISWPVAAGYNLQQNNNLAAPSGWTASGYSITTANGTNSITISHSAGNLFFRLDNP